MTVQEYESRIAQLKRENKGYISFDFRGQNPVEFLRIEVLEEIVTADAFRWEASYYKDQNGKWQTKQKDKIVDWAKDFILGIGLACGIEADRFVSEKIGKYSYVSKASVYRLLPSGNKQYTPADYEFDAEIRAEEIIVKDQIRNMDTPDKRRYKTQAEEKLVVIELAKSGRSKADTGAHKRAIIKMLHQIPAPDKTYIGWRFFCFQCVPDMSHKAVRNMFLSSDDAAYDLFGTPSRQIEAPLKDVTHDQVSHTIDARIVAEIKQERNILQEHKAMYKLAGMVLEQQYDLENFHRLIKSYLKMGKEQRVTAMINWLDRIAPVNEGILQADMKMKQAYLVRWSQEDA